MKLVTVHSFTVVVGIKIFGFISLVGILRFDHLSLLGRKIWGGVLSKGLTIHEDEFYRVK